MSENPSNEGPKRVTLRTAALGIATAAFLLWTAWLLANPLEAKSKNENRLALADRLGYVERSLQDMIVGIAVIPIDPPAEALRKWRVLFITYRKQIEQLRPEDPALEEIAPYLTRVYALVDRAEVVRKDILAGKYGPEEAKVADRDFRKYLELASDEIRVAAQSLRRSASKSTANLLGFPGYPIAAAILAAVFCGLLCRAEWRQSHPPIQVLPSPWPGGESPWAVQAQTPLPTELAALMKEPYFEPNGMDAMRRLAGRFAHNFNNLLTTINGYTDLLFYSMDDKDPNRDDLEEIKKAGEKAAFLTSGLLAFSGRQVAKPKLVDLSELIRNMQGAIAPMLGPQSSLELDLSEDLDHVQVDPAQFEQVVLSLAGNARDAMPEGGALRIATFNAKSNQVGARPRPCRKPCVVVTFKDTGTAMDDQTRDQIFEPFFTTHDPGKGTGLGLSAAYGIIRQNGGTIRVRSDKGQGTTFTVYFPSGEEGGEWAGAAQVRMQQSRFNVKTMRAG